MKHFTDTLVFDGGEMRDKFLFVAAASGVKDPIRQWSRWIHIEESEKTGNTVAVATDAKRMHVFEFPSIAEIKVGDYEIIQKTKSKLVIARIPENEDRIDFPNYKRVISTVSRDNKVTEYDGSKYDWISSYSRLIHAIPVEMGVNPKFTESLKGYVYDVYLSKEMLCFENKAGMMALIMSIDLEVPR